MFIGIELENKPEIFEYRRHGFLFFFGKVTKSVPTAQAGKNSVAPGWSAGEMWIFACMGLFEQF